MRVGEDVKVNAAEVGGVCKKSREDVRTLSLVRKDDRILMIQANAYAWNGLQFGLCPLYWIFEWVACILFLLRSIKLAKHRMLENGKDSFLCWQRDAILDIHLLLASGNRGVRSRSQSTVSVCRCMEQSTAETTACGITQLQVTTTYEG